MNGGFDYREQIGVAAAGRCVIDHLVERYRHSSEAEWRARIDSGRVLVDARIASSDTVLRRGQIVTWRRPAWAEPEAPRGFAVLFEDDDLLAVAKPAGSPVLPGAGFLQSTLLVQVRRYAAEASPLHRLGRWTSGIVLFARTRTSRASLSAQWASRAIVKRYRALATGDPAESEFEIEVPIGPVPHPLLGSVHAASAEGKAASSRVVVLERRESRFVCDVMIGTGRPHQIRIHLAAAGHPLVGDPLYTSGGLPAPASRALPGDPGYLLHATELAFNHPRTERRVEIRCSPPPELRG